MYNTIYFEYENKESKIIVEEIDHPVHRMLHALFEDGYENIFFTDIETGEWVEQDIGYSSLAKTLGKMLSNDCNASKMQQQITWHHEKCTRPIHFGFTKHQVGANIFYLVFGSNKRYMFTLQNNESLWKVIKHNYVYSWNFDTDYFVEIPFILDLYGY